MLEARRDPRFVEEHFAQLSAISKMRLYPFERDDLYEALNSAALGDVEAAHSALPQQSQQLVAAKSLCAVGRHLLRVHRMSTLDHAETLSSLYPRWFRANNDANRSFNNALPICNVDDKFSRDCRCVTFPFTQRNVAPDTDRSWIRESEYESCNEHSITDFRGA